MWSGLGVNYKAKQENWAADAAYFKSIGLTCIRPNLSSVPATWVIGSEASGGYAFWRNCAKYFADRSFWVTWGVSGLSGADTGMTATQWGQYHDSVVAEAEYCQSIGLSLGCFEIGNEIEGKIDGTTLTNAQLVTNLKQLATDVKAVYSLSPIGYSCYDRGDTFYDQFITQGLGDIDFIGLHPYGNIANGGQAIKNGGYNALQKMVTAFGSKCIVTEFNIDSTDSNILKVTEDEKVASMRRLYGMIRSAGVKKAMVYSWVGWLNVDNQFAMKNTDGSFNNYWDVLLTDNGRRTFVTV